ncbi:hypothetical protein V8E51_005453 [Hyaloscypha variabilis]
MPTTRRSSRLKGDAPGVEPITRRARRPNRNTLAEFAKSQSPVIAKGSGIRKKVKTPERIRALTKLVEASTKILAAPLPSKSTNPPPAEPTSPSIRGTPNAVICQNYNVNLGPRDSLSDLQEYVWKKFIQKWILIRKLKPWERPVLSHWLVTVGNPKTSGHTIRVEDDEAWASVETLLRQLEKDGGTDRKYAHKLNIDAVYETHERTKTPPPALVKDSTDFVDLEDDDEDEDLDLLLVYKGPVGKRASATTRQLTQKRLRDQSNPQ